MARKKIPKSDDVLKKIKADLLEQLEKQNKKGAYFNDLIDDYCRFYKMKEELFNDVETNGIRIKSMTGNGFEIEKENESIKNLKMVNTQMLQILAKLDLYAPTIDDSDDLDDYL